MSVKKLYLSMVGSGILYGGYKGFNFARKDYLQGKGGQIDLVVCSLFCGVVGGLAGAVPPLGIAALYVVEFEKTKPPHELNNVRRKT